jgi:protein tyrosine/serine phosphatase
MNTNTSAPDRHLPFDTVFNVRDLGGYVGDGGRRIRWRTVLRADGLHRLSGDDLVRFAELGVHTVIDLRTHIELEERGRLGAGGEVDIRYHHLPLMQRNWDPQSYDPEVGPVRFLADRYLDMIEGGRDAVAAALRIIADPSHMPLVFHCAAGKDRTGVLAAITLSLLGVSDDDVAADYALSAEAVDRFGEWLARTKPEAAEELRLNVPAGFVAAPAPAMHLFLTELRDRYGSIEAYAAEVGLGSDDLADLRSHLLE